jgi:hypothetical protein
MNNSVCSADSLPLTQLNTSYLHLPVRSEMEIIGARHSANYIYFNSLHENMRKSRHIQNVLLVDRGHSARVLILNLVARLILTSIDVAMGLVSRLGQDGSDEPNALRSARFRACILIKSISKALLKTQCYLSS